MPLIAGEMDKIRDYVRMGWFKRSWSIREGDWKYIMYGPINTGKTRPELFNLENDPTESDNLFDKRPDITDLLELELRRFISRLPPCSLLIL